MTDETYYQLAEASQHHPELLALIVKRGIDAFRVEQLLAKLAEFDTDMEKDEYINLLVRSNKIFADEFATA